MGGCASSSPASIGCTTSSAASAAISPRKEEETFSTSAHSKYKFGEKIGRGSFAQVHVAIRRQTKAEVAVKVFPLHPERIENRQLEMSINELIAWRAVGTHVNCVQLVESFFDEHLGYMVMKKCDSTLFGYLRGHEAVYETCLGKTFEHILTGLSHMHSVSVMHRDLKPDNLLVRGRTVKICDFGLSVMVPESGFVTGAVGTAPYMPPEMLATNTYDETADVWSFGVVAYLFLCGDFPYHTSDGSAKAMVRSILNGAAPCCNRAWLSVKAVSFLQQLLKRKPSQRPTAKLALRSPFISKPDTENLPCIKSVLVRKARSTGAFDANDIDSTTETDEILNKLKNKELGTVSTKSFSNVSINNVLSNWGAKARRAKQVGESSDSPSSRSESTACGSSSSTFASSKISI